MAKVSTKYHKAAHVTQSRKYPLTVKGGREMEENWIGERDLGERGRQGGGKRVGDYRELMRDGFKGWDERGVGGKG